MIYFCFYLFPSCASPNRAWPIFLNLSRYYHLQNQTSSSLPFRALRQKTCRQADRDIMWHIKSTNIYPKETDFTVTVYWSIHKAHKQMEAIAIMQIRHLCFYCKYTAYLLPQGHGKRQSDKASQNLIDYKKIKSW